MVAKLPSHCEHDAETLSDGLKQSLAGIASIMTKPYMIQTRKPHSIKFKSNITYITCS